MGGTLLSKDHCMYNADSGDDDATPTVNNIRSDCRILYNAGIGDDDETHEI